MAVATAMLLLVARRAALSGSWLDEYWQLWISRAPDAATLFARIAADAHPPWFNLLARPISALTGGSLPGARLLSIALAVALAALGLTRLARSEAQGRARLLYLLAGLFVLGLVAAGDPLGAAASFRSYPWLIALTLLQGALLLQVARGTARPVAPASAALLTAAATMFHYVHAVAAISIALVTLACALRRGQRRTAVAIAAGLAAGVLLQVTTGLIQLPQWRLHNDHSWITAAGISGAGVIGEVVGTWFLLNLPATIVLALAAVRRQLPREAFWVLAPIPLAAAVWLVMGQVTPVLVDRYAVAIPILLSLAAAAAADRLLVTPQARAIVALLLFLNLALSDFGRPLTAGWEPEAAAIAAERARCPSTQVLATSHWNLGAARASRAAAFEAPVAHSAYATIGRRFDFEPTIVAPDRPVTIAPGACPTILWIEHVSDLDAIGPDRILALSGVIAPRGTQVRLIKGENGGLLRIDPAPSPGGSPNSSNLRQLGAKGRP
ncbi:MAG: hypothetical protein ABIR77_07600 [Sphingomicrobium sp.]